MFVSLSLPRVEGADLRPWVPPEHSLVISSVHDAQEQADGGGNAAGQGSASLLTLEWEAASQMAQQKLQVRPVLVAVASHGREGRQQTPESALLSAPSAACCLHPGSQCLLRSRQSSCAEQLSLWRL